ncbi:MAG: MraY family glycosyltransferase [Bacillota bacterium]|nr:MraY family glycosyltransferase [Bacillota bacterium]
MNLTYEYFVSFILAFIVALSSTPIAKKAALKFGAVDIPNDERRIHKKPIPRLGGLAIVAGFFVSLLFNIVNDAITNGVAFELSTQMLGLIGGMLIIVVVGVLDDIKQLSAKVKILFHLAAAIVVVIAGTKINVLYGFTLSPYISYPLTIFWIIGITNAINLIDGLDGLAAGVSSIASLSLFFVSIITSRGDIAIITAVLAGSTLGFLPFNFNPAKIFMGDTGSNFLGFALGVISIQGTIKSYTAIAIAIPLLVLGLPLFDTIFAILRRLAGGKSIMAADRGHIHHKLIDMGLSQRQSVVALYTASGALGLCAVVLAGRGVLSAIILVVSISVFIIGGARFMTEMETDKDKEEEPKVDAVENKISNVKE